MDVKVDEKMLELLGYEKGTSVEKVQAEFDLALERSAELHKAFMAGRTEAVTK